MTEPPRQPNTSELDWDRARQILAAYLRHRLTPIDADVLEDLVQESLVRLFRMSLRGPIRNLEATANSISDSVASDHHRGHKRRIAFLQRFARHHDGPVDPGSLGDPLDRIYFIVIAYFRKVQAPCADLAEQYFSRVEWKELAQREGRSHAGIRKLWSRCTEQLRRAFGDDDGPFSRWFDE